MRVPRTYSLWRSMCVPTLVAAAAALTLAVSGCLTDGSIPVGGGSANGVLRGVVVLADNPDIPMPGARITVRSPEGVSFRLRSSDDGTFGFGNVPAGTLEVIVDGPQPGIYMPVRIDVRTQYASFSSVAVALDLARMVQSEVTAVRITPRDAAVPLGGVIQFSAEITGGNPLRRIPTWVLEGGVGSISPRGEVLAQQAGTGTVRAIAGNVFDSTAITVTSP